MTSRATIQTASVVFALVLGSVTVGQSSVTGTLETEPSRLPKALIQILPEPGRPFTPPDLELNFGLGVNVRLEEGRRAGHFDLVIDGKKRSFRAPGTIDIDLRNARKKEREHRFEIQETDGKYFIRALSGVEFDVSKRHFCVLDLDADGAFDGDLDGWVERAAGARRWGQGDDQPEIHSRFDPTTVDGQNVWFKSDRDGFWVQVTDVDPRPPVNLSESGVFRFGEDSLINRLNVYRRAVGLPAVGSDQSLAEACLSHAKYCDLHGESSSEQEGEQGYTKEGAAIAPVALTWRGTPYPGMVLDAVGGVDSRAQLLDPGAVRVGLGESRKYTVVAFATRAVPSLLPPFVWPPNAAVNVPWYSPRGDKPSPLGDKTFEGTSSWSYGYPITVHLLGKQPEDVTFELKLEDKPVEVYLSWPGHPGNASRPDNADAIVAIPKAELAPEKEYHCRVACKLDGKPFEDEWKFTTRKKADDESKE